MTNLLSFISIIVLVYYIYSLLKNSSNKNWRKPLLIGATLTFIIGFGVHILILKEVSIDAGDNGWFATVWMALISTLELFIGSTRMFDNGVQDVLFKKISESTPHTTELIILTATYLAAIISTSYLIGTFIIRRFSSQRWLKKNRPNNDEQIYILFGLNIYVKYLIKDLRKRHPNAIIVAVNNLTDDEIKLDVPLLDRIRNLFMEELNDGIEGANVLLKSKMNVAYANSQDLCGSLGLKYLKPFLDKNSIIYLMLDNQDENLSALNNLLESKISCSRIYCRICRNELNDEIEEALRYIKDNNVGNCDFTPDVVFIDSSFLSIRSLLRPSDYDYSALPVNYVKIAKDKEGQNLGYVESGFKAMILGFGETGQEALTFLYEYGAFVAKNKKKALFECHVFDNNMDSILGKYAVSHPGMNHKSGIFYHQTEIGSGAFWELFESQLKNTNYIVVCVDSDWKNLTFVKQITQHLGEKDTSDLFRIMVKQTNPDSIMKKTLEFMSSKENYCIRPFGMAETIWQEKVITDDDLTELAKKYHLNYATANNEDNKTPNELARDWEKREVLIHKTDTPRGKRLNEIRKRSQDYANCLHISTKLKLMEGPLLYNAKDVAENIPGLYDGKLFNGDSHTASIIEYMAIGEHLRWEASHAAMGFRPGRNGEETNSELRIHRHIQDYEKLSPIVKHYDWVVIKTTLELFYKEKNNQ